MNKTQQSILQAYYSLRNVAEQNKSTWKDNVIFTASYNKFLAQITLIEDYVDIQRTKSGSSDAKNEKKNQVVETGAFFSNRLKRFALDIGDNELITATDFSDGDLRHLLDNELVATSNLIAEKVTTNITALLPYSITQVLLDDYKVDITAFEKSIGDPKTTILKSKNATAMLGTLYRETEKVLEDGMDLDIEVFKTSNPKFYIDYFGGRKVNKAPSVTTSLFCKVVEKGKNIGVKGVQVVFRMVMADKTLSADTIIKKTTDKGNFKIGTMAEGVYELTVTKTGYKEQKISVTIVKGETTRLTVEIEKS
jgi:hypothetical protein